jgi:hypothetical protein
MSLRYIEQSRLHPLPLRELAAMVRRQPAHGTPAAPLASQFCRFMTRCGATAASGSNMWHSNRAADP